MKKMLLYHGTSPIRLEKILEEGFSLEAERVSDPGDFGWAVYLTGSLSRAKAAGWKNVLQVEVNLKNPLVFKTEKGAYSWFLRNMHSKYGNSIIGPMDKRIESAKKYREVLMKEGYDSVVVELDGYSKEAPWEVAIFDLTCIKNIKRFSYSNKEREHIEV